MKLTILGSGVAVPRLGRYPSAYLLQTEGATMVLDCGPFLLTRLLEHQIDFQELTAVCVTHFHPDHFAHFMPLVTARFVDDIYEKRNHRELTVLAPATFQERWQKLREVSWPEPEEYPLRVYEGAQTVKIGDLSIQSFSVTHVPWFPCVGYRITQGGKTLVYTGDLGSQQTEETFTALAGADVLLIEAGAPASSQTHLTAQQAVAIGKKAGAKKIVLTHLRESIIAMAQQEAAQNPNLVVVAQDNLEIEIS
jgi:ribonuclease BN (tRNA processing enzyme)